MFPPGRPEPLALPTAGLPLFTVRPGLHRGDPVLSILLFRQGEEKKI